MMIAIGVICMHFVLWWDAAVIFVINGGTIEDLYEDEDC